MISIFGLTFTSERDTGNVVNEIFQRLARGEGGLVITANPEMMLHAWRDHAFHAIMQKALLKTIDGTGLAIVGSCILKKRLHRAHGSDLFPFIMERAEMDAIPVQFIVNPEGLTDKELLRQKLARLWPRLHFSIATSEDELSPHAQLIIANHGSPIQESILQRTIENRTAPCIGIGIGAALDFLVGTQIRAPVLLRRIGLEWLYRLIKQPWRIRRIINATIIFPITALFHLHD